MQTLINILLDLQTRKCGTLQFCDFQIQSFMWFADLKLLQVQKYRLFLLTNTACNPLFQICQNKTNIFKKTILGLFWERIVRSFVEIIASFIWIYLIRLPLGIPVKTANAEVLEGSHIKWRFKSVSFGYQTDISACWHRWQAGERARGGAARREADPLRKAAAVRMSSARHGPLTLHCRTGSTKVQAR